MTGRLVLGESNGLPKGDWGRQQLRGKEESGERALPPGPKLLTGDRLSII